MSNTVFAYLYLLSLSCIPVGIIAAVTTLIWLNPSDEAVTKNPPNNNHINLCQSIGLVDAIRKPIPEENTTRLANLNLVKIT